MKKIYRHIVFWLMETSFYRNLLKNIIPYIRFSTYYTKLRGSVYHRLYKKLEPGDVLLSLDRKKLTTLLIPGDFSHASLCVDIASDWEVSEMTHNDYTKSTFFDICKESDRVVIMRLINATPMTLVDAVSRCKGFEGATYDVRFDLGIESLYCSELVYQSFKDNVLGASIDDLVGLGRPYISPTGLYRAKNLILIADSDDL
jgi:hypothetical protein